MDLQIPKLQTKTLRLASDPAAYQLYRAAQEWDLVEPILINDRQDLKSEPKWREHIEPCLRNGHEGSTRTAEALRHSDDDEYLYAHGLTGTA